MGSEGFSMDREIDFSAAGLLPGAQFRVVPGRGGGEGNCFGFRGVQ